MRHLWQDQHIHKERCCTHVTFFVSRLPDTDKKWRKERVRDDESFAWLIFFFTDNNNCLSDRWSSSSSSPSVHCVHPAWLSSHIHMLCSIPLFPVFRVLPCLTPHSCPIDDEIMGPFQYSHNKTRATVSFQAHKFPYTSSVYYQCNVRLCLKESGGCEDVVCILVYCVVVFSQSRKFIVSQRGPLFPTKQYQDMYMTFYSSSV